MKKLFGRLSGKGLIAAACAGLVIVGGAGVYSYNKVADRLNEQLISSNAEKTPPMPDAPVNAEQTQIAKTTVPKVTEAPSEETVSSAEASEVTDAAPVREIRAMVRPLNGEVLNPFSHNELVRSSTLNVWKTHDGVDIAGNLSEKVKSMSDGTVSAVYEACGN